VPDAARRLTETAISRHDDTSANIDPRAASVGKGSAVSGFFAADRVWRMVVLSFWFVSRVQMVEGLQRELN
jgi:hypothetical protein